MVFSLFFFRYKEGDHYALELDLEEFLEPEMAAGYGCDYAMQFAGDDTISNFTTSGAIPQFTTQEAIDRSITNLNKFHLVCVLEHLPEFIKEFHALYQMKLEIPRLRKNPVSEDFKDKMVTPEILAQEKELNKPNIAIYEYVVNNLLTKH